MTTHADGTFKVEDWQEEEYGSLGDGRKLSRASVRQAISGDIEGTGNVEWLMCYRPDETACSRSTAGSASAAAAS